MQDDAARCAPKGRYQSITAGLILIGLGCLFFADNRGWLELRKLQSYWPAIIGLIGLSQMIAARNADQMAKGGLLVFLSAWLYASLEHLWGLNFFNSWPLLLIALGLSKVISGLFKPDDAAADKSS
ncbi:LiaI-LiaF-like domain-containing protein [Roseateles oligotrophus]|uniref:DUF5668 domain-containing protein n=1 Tax=Roseateles oligotrophus TaxID=1769250 RepID=A0ABT2YLD8_9BURK|nr:DUF5668 domain-containing protein [Roseateles oligotrophus]MCV2370877.1 DUF5668 domain-containing protein [Roseateles oligotrophus]